MIGSINSIVGNAGASAYCASKGGVLMLGKTLALDWLSTESASTSSVRCG